MVLLISAFVVFTKAYVAFDCIHGLLVRVRSGMAKYPKRQKKPREETAPKVVLTARVDQNVLERLRALALADDRTLSYMAERAIKEYVERHT